MKALTRNRIWIARLVAIIADGLQWFLFPLFAEGFASPLDDALDIVLCLVLTGLVGWHWSFTPSLVIKVLPGLDEIPTWTLSVLYATRRANRRPELP